MKYLAFIIVFVSFAFNGNSQHIDKAFNSIFNYIKTKDLNSALSSLDSLDNNKVINKDANYYYNRAIAYLLCYESKDTADSNDFSYLQNSYTSLEAVLNLDSEKNYYSNAIELIERVGSHFLMNGVEEFNNKQYQNALTDFKKVIKINEMPDINRVDTIVYFNAAISSEKLGDTTQAIHYFENVVWMNFGGTFSFIELSDLYSATNQNQKAIDVLQTAYSEFPGNENILNAIINLFIKVKQYDDAEPWIRILVNKNPSDVLFFTLGSIYNLQNKTDSAEVNYIKALSLNPNHQDALFNLGLLYYLKAIDTIKTDTGGKKIPKSAKELLVKSNTNMQKLYKLEPNNVEAVKMLISINKLLKNKELEQKYTLIYQNKP